MIQKVDRGEIIAIAHGAGPRSPHFSTVKNAYLRLHPNCEADDPSYFGKVCVQVHHVHAFHVCVLLGRADLELDARNFRGLCEDEPGKPCQNHHVLLGHDDDFQVNNEFVLDDVKTYLGWTEKDILADPAYQGRMKNRPKPFPQWTVDEKKAYRKMLDDTLPPDPVLLAKYFTDGLPEVKFE